MAASKRHHTKTAQRVAAREEEKHRAWKLTVAGMTIRDIARILGCSHGKAHTLVREALAEVPERLKAERVALADARIDGIVRAHWPLRKDGESAKVVLAAVKQSRELFGLDAPTRTEISGKGGGPLVTFDLSKLTDEQLERLCDGDPSALPGGDAGGTSGAGDSGEGTPPA